MGNDQSVSRKTFPGKTSKRLDKVRIELADCAFANGSKQFFFLFNDIFEPFFF